MLKRGKKVQKPSLIGLTEFQITRNESAYYKVEFVIMDRLLPPLNLKMPHFLKLTAFCIQLSGVFLKEFENLYLE